MFMELILTCLGVIAEFIMMLVVVVEVHREYKDIEIF